MNTGNTEIIDDVVTNVLTPTWQNAPLAPGSEAGAESFRDTSAFLRHVFPDFTITHEDFYGLLDAVAAYGFAAHLTAEEGRKVLREYIHRVAEAGRLRVREDLATLMVHTAGCGTALGLLAQPAEQRDLALSTANREALIAAITTDQQHDTGPVEPATAAVTRAGDARNDHHARGRRGEGTAGIPGGVTAGGEFGRLSPPRRRLPA